jgi:hypothetical protein
MRGALSHRRKLVRPLFRFCFFNISCGAPPIEDPMSEVRRLKMKIGDAEFEAEVAEDEVQPMYDQFLSMLGGRRLPPAPTGFVETTRTAFDQSLLTQIFDFREDGVIVLKMLPEGPDNVADAILLLLYGYDVFKNEQCVLATQLIRAAKQSGIWLRRPIHECIRKNDRFVIHNGQRKGSNYALNNEGLAVANEIIAKILSKAKPKPAGVLASTIGEVVTIHPSR